MTPETEIRAGIAIEVESITDPDVVRPNSDRRLRKLGMKLRRKSRAKCPKPLPPVEIPRSLFEEIHAEAEHSLFIRSKFPLVELVESDPLNLPAIRQVKDPKLTIILIKGIFGYELESGPGYIACIVVAIDTKHDELLLDQEDHEDVFPNMDLFKGPLYPDMIERVYDLTER